jgi:parvulin-like peptidyl-prolyl isomerase
MRTVLVILLAATWTTGALGAGPADGDATWRPAASERLVRLPAGYLERAIDRDFQGSPLATALDETGRALADRNAGLGELQAAVEAAAGDERDALRQRFLEEKQAYLQLMGRRHDLERERLKTRLALYERLLTRLRREGGVTDNPAAAQLAENRQAAQSRFEASVARVDMALFADGAAAESRYGAEYRRHAEALGELVAAINAHPMNRAPEIDGRSVDKREFLRHLAGQAEAELALLDQQDLVLAYMAKLVALDAMAMADEVDAREAEAAGRPETLDVSAAVGFFVAPN